MCRGGGGSTKAAGSASAPNTRSESQLLDRRRRPALHLLPVPDLSRNCVRGDVGGGGGDSSQSEDLEQTNTLRSTLRGDGGSGGGGGGDSSQSEDLEQTNTLRSTLRGDDGTVSVPALSQPLLPNLHVYGGLRYLVHSPELPELAVRTVSAPLAGSACLRWIAVPRTLTGAPRARGTYSLSPPCRICMSTVDCGTSYTHRSSQSSRYVQSQPSLSPSYRICISTVDCGTSYTHRSSQSSRHVQTSGKDSPKRTTNAP